MGKAKRSDRDDDEVLRRGGKDPDRPRNKKKKKKKAKDDGGACGWCCCFGGAPTASSSDELDGIHPDGVLSGNRADIELGNLPTDGYHELEVDGLRGGGGGAGGSGRDSGRGKKKRKVKGKAAIYTNVLADKPESFFDVASYRLEWGDFSNYKLFRNKKVGEGAYGSVFLAMNRTSKEHCVVKTIKPEKEQRIKIQQEVKMLQYLRGGADIIELQDLVRDPKLNLKMLVFEYVRNPDYKVTFRSFDDMGARLYLWHLVRALNYTHSMGVIHRDVKGGNVLFDPDTKKFRLIDWGFGEYYRPGHRIAKWPGTRYYKSPELFLHYEYYDYAVDMWAVGCMLGAIIFKISVLFRGENNSQDNMAHMVAIGKLLGLDDYEAFLSKYQSTRKYKFPYYDRYKVLPGVIERQRTDWSHLLMSENRHMANDDALDLLDRLLTWDHEERITAREALDHPYFYPIREQYGDGGTAGTAGTSGSTTRTLSRSPSTSHSSTT